GAVDAVSRAGDAIINALTNVAVLLKTFLERIVEVLTNILQYMKSLFELNPEEIVRIAIETQKALLGLGPWLQSQA
ncbi:hypothetical protein, partial [Metallosphaera sp.]|uniref:hypothetical protein n=1 Tax=Metallosphaera sp. TaxID=2020860 RepID=UPI003172CC7F